MARLKVLVDTDIGTDADDAVCLSYLLRHDACEVVGITTVGRDADQRARIAEALCRHFGQPEIPIAAGADAPLFPNRYWRHHQVNQSAIADRCGVTRSYPRGGALDLMRRLIRQHPGELVLLTLGMLSNAALLAAADPEATALLKEIVLMGGRFDYPPDAPRTECNVMLDPTAAGTLLTRDTAPLLVVSGDSIDRATGGLSFTREEMERHFAHDHLRPVLDCCRCWVDRNGSGRLGLADPFTSCVMLNPHLCTYDAGRVGVKLYDYDVERGFKLDGDEVTGVTHFTACGEGPHRLARNGDVSAFVTDLLAVLQG